MKFLRGTTVVFGKPIKNWKLLTIIAVTAAFVGILIYYLGQPAPVIPPYEG